MVKAAPAPAQSSSGGWLKGAGVIALILGGIWFAADQGWIGGSADPELQPDRGPQVLVTFEAVWGQIRDTGEVYEDTGKPKRTFECEEREVTITYWIDGERHAADPSDSDVDEPCMWRHTTNASQGAELRLLVEEAEMGGYKMCVIYVNERIALPNGWAIQPEGGDCDVWGVAA